MKSHTCIQFIYLIHSRSNPIAVRSLDSLSETSDGSTSSAHSTQPTSASAHSPDRTQSDVSLDTGAACLESEDVAVVTERNPFSAVSSEDYQVRLASDCVTLFRGIHDQFN